MLTRSSFVRPARVREPHRRDGSASSASTFVHACKHLFTGRFNRQAGDRLRARWGLRAIHAARSLYVRTRNAEFLPDCPEPACPWPRRWGAPPPHARASPHARLAHPHLVAHAPRRTPPRAPLPHRHLGGTIDSLRGATGDAVSARVAPSGIGVEACPAITAIWTRAPSSSPPTGERFPAAISSIRSAVASRLPEHHPQASVIDLSNARWVEIAPRIVHQEIERLRPALAAQGPHAVHRARRVLLWFARMCARARDLRRRGRRGRAVVDGSGEIARDGPHERGEVDPGPCGARREYRYDADPHP